MAKARVLKVCEHQVQVQVPICRTGWLYEVTDKVRKMTVPFAGIIFVNFEASWLCSYLTTRAISCLNVCFVHMVTSCGTFDAFPWHAVARPPYVAKYQMDVVGANSFFIPSSRPTNSGHCYTLLSFLTPCFEFSSHIVISQKII